MRYAVMASCPSQIGDDKKVMEKVRKVSDWMKKTAAAAAAAISITFLPCPLTSLPLPYPPSSHVGVRQVR